MLKTNNDHKFLHYPPKVLSLLMYHEVFHSEILSTGYISLDCMDIRISRCYFRMQHKPVGFCNLEEFQPNHTSGRQQESMTIPKAAHTIL